jgi:hypothetical protein
MPRLHLSSLRSRPWHGGREAVMGEAVMARSGARDHTVLKLVVVSWLTLMLLGALAAGVAMVVYAVLHKSSTKMQRRWLGVAGGFFFLVGVTVMVIPPWVFLFKTG